MPRSSVPTTPPTVSVRDWAAMVKQAWGDAWFKRETSYDFSNGRKFVDPEQNGGPYSGTGGNG